MSATTFLDRSLEINGKKIYPLKNVLVYDIECGKKNLNKGVSPENSTFKIWGAFSYKTGKLMSGTTGNFQQLVNQHDIIVGHNIKGYDNPIMEQQLGINFRGKTIIDLLEVLRPPATKSEKIAMAKKGKKPIYGKGRANIIGEARIIGMNDMRFPDLKLSTIASHGYKLFKDNDKFKEYFQEYKQENFDYNVLSQKELSDAQWNYVKRYMYQDIIVTKNIFEFLDKYFESLAHYLPMHDILNLEYIHAPTGKFNYKVMCNLLNLQEEYSDNIPRPFIGAYVFLPFQDYFSPVDGDGYCRDFTSQHPSHIHSANLCTPISQCPTVRAGKADKCPKPYNGDGKIFKLKGTYCTCKKGRIETLISNLLQDKINFKKAKDPREWTVKIIINGCYGVLSSSIFKSTYCETTGPDTTLMSQQSTKYMAKWMKQHGYIVTYGDTDSIYIIDPFRDKQKMNTIVANGVENIKLALPFADNRYKMGIDAEFTHIFFFEDEKEHKHKKKNYIYIQKVLDKDGNDTGKRKLKLNGLPILKRNAPKLAKKIFVDHMEQEILRREKIGQKGNIIKFSKDEVDAWVKWQIEQNRDILKTRIRVNPAGSYASESQLQSQISVNYFEGKEGIFEGIKHKRKGYGVGKGKHYCSMEESHKLAYAELDLETVYKTLDPFIRKDKQQSLTDWE